MDMRNNMQCESLLNTAILKLNIVLEIISDLVDLYIDSSPQVINVAILLKV